MSVITVNLHGGRPRRQCDLLPYVLEEAHLRYCLALQQVFMFNIRATWAVCTTTCSPLCIKFSLTAKQFDSLTINYLLLLEYELIAITALRQHWQPSMRNSQNLNLDIFSYSENRNGQRTGKLILTLPILDKHTPSSLLPKHLLDVFWQQTLA